MVSIIHLLYPPKVVHEHCFNSSWDDCKSKKKVTILLMKNTFFWGGGEVMERWGGGGGGVNKVHYPIVKIVKRTKRNPTNT